MLALAQDEAIRLNHDHIGPEHLLLGLIREGEGIAARVLESLGIDLSRARRDVERTVPRREGAPPRDIRLDPRTKRVMEAAVQEAQAIGDGAVGTEHLLLGLVRVMGEDTGTAAAKVIASLAIQVERVRREVMLAIAGRVATTGPHGTRVTAMPPDVAWDEQGRRRDWYCEDVLSGKLKVKVLYEDERVLGFEHPYPQYQIHAVIVPKAHVPSLLAAEALDAALLASMLRGVQEVARGLGLDTQGFRVEANAAAPGVTPHMHWHVAGPGLPPPPRAQQ
ncbi:MAG: HIT domain-containing protein [Chloroflexota bacterium]|nr:HIT domain-containing protein [Chloroflexota bacterium]MDE3194355.1 HIT domain-containing protein [Chloroflexota bacterium]